MSVLQREAQDLVHASEDVLPPAELNLLLLLTSRNAGLREVQVALVLLRVFQNDLDHRTLLPVVESPLHLDVLALTQS